MYLTLYQNSTHVADVVHAVLYLISSDKLKDCLTDLEVFSLFVAAICHDYRHPGVGNAYLIKIEDPLAIRYNDKSVLENFHLSESYSIILSTETNILKNFSVSDKALFRKIFISCILATDVSCHFQLVNDFEQKLTKPEELDFHSDEYNETKDLLLKVLLHAADISNPAKVRSRSNILSCLRMNVIE